MIDIRRAVIIGSVLAVTNVAAANAADIILPRGGGYKDRPAQVELVPSPVGVPQTASWYIRGDVAYAFHDDPELNEKFLPTLDLAREDYEETWTIGGGIGHYITPNLRGDITVDYRDKSKVSADDLSAAAPFGGATRSFDVSSLVVLANLYYDFHSYSAGGFKDGPVSRSRITPYVGIGLGFVTHWMEDGTSIGCGCNGIIADETSTSVAAALMAGFNWDLRYNLTMDAGYRFLYMGELNTGDLYNAFSNAGSMELDQLYAHEFRLGLRYDIF